MRLTYSKILILFFFYTVAHCQDKIDTTKNDTYSFTLIDYPFVQTSIRANNRNYLCAYSLASNTLRNQVGDRQANGLLILFNTLFLTPLTHEEGHRAILTERGIGSISDPVFSLKGAAYVKGVEDITLQNLRDENLPSYLRLHSAGLESDYALINRINSEIFFNQSEFQTYKTEYIVRLGSYINYFLLSPFKVFEPNITEEANELDRDIVGHDIYGFVRHINRPTDSFYRYTKYDDLLANERKFVNRAALKSLLNLLNTIYFYDNTPNLNSTIYNFGLGYFLTPFGDAIALNNWITTKKQLNIQNSIYYYKNLERAFWGLDLNIVDYRFKKSYLTLGLKGWLQPENGNSKTNNARPGGMIDINWAIPIFHAGKNKERDFFLFELGFASKTNGFALEEVALGAYTGLRMGGRFIVNSKVKK